MSTYTGNDGVVQIGGNAVGEVVSFSVTENADRVEDTVLTDTNRTYKAGLADVNGTIECRYDPGDTNGQVAMTVGATVSLVLHPQGTGSGLAEWTVSATILSINTNVQFNEIIGSTFEWGAAGTLTKGTQS